MIHLLFELLKPEVLILWLLTGFIIGALTISLFKTVDAVSDNVHRVFFDWSDFSIAIALTLSGPISLFQLLILAISSYLNLDRKKLCSFRVKKRNPYKDGSQPQRENKKPKP